MTPPERTAMVTASLGISVSWAYQWDGVTGVIKLLMLIFMAYLVIINEGQ